MAIDKTKGAKNSETMLQIQNMQKSVLSESFFDDPKTEEKDATATIHSGHFMVSRVHEDKDEDDDEETPLFSDDSKDFAITMGVGGYDFVQANKSTSQTYNFGPMSTQTLSIDASLTKLFECMTLAYSGKITSPKWKPFRGMHLTVKDKVRLNNIIWREWHMQYIFLRKPIVCQFATPLSDYIHTKPEAVVLEGKYWKRRLDTVTKEYKKWRRFYRDRALQAMPETLFSPSLHPSTESLSEWELLERVKEVQVMPVNVLQSSTDLTLLNTDMEMDFTDFTDNLFSSLNQPFAFPNPKELGGLSCADLIQPGLVQLQPNLEDFMDIDTMQEFLAVSRCGSMSSFLSQSTPSSAQMSGATLNPPYVQHSQSFGLLDPSLFSSSSINNSAGINMLTALVALTSSSVALNSGAMSASNNSVGSSPLFSTDTSMIVEDGKQQPAFTPVLNQQAQQQQQQHRHFLASPFGGSGDSVLKRSPQSAPALHGHAPTQTVNVAGLGLIQSTSPSSLQRASSSPGTHLPFSSSSTRPGSQQSKLSKSELKAAVRKSHPSATITSDQAVTGQSPSAAKKDGFVVPQGKPVAMGRKPRVIAPAPAPSAPATAPSMSSPSMQSTMLAQLLTQGTYPGALISVKTEPPSAAAVAAASSVGGNFTHILPAPGRSQQPQRQARNANPVLAPKSSPVAAPTSPASSPMRLTSDFATEISKSGVDFPTRVVLAAASSALGTTSSSLKDVLRFGTSSVVTSMAEPSRFSTTAPKARSPVPMALSPSSVTPPSSPSASAVLSEALSPVSSYDSPLSPASALSPDDGGMLGGIRLGIHTEQRRQAHLSAEQKRRCNLKSGFDLLHTLVPALAQNPKVSKATMLQKTAEHCRKMKMERAQMQHEAAILKQEIESLNNAISVVQSQLPETGVPVTRQRVDQMKEMFEEYVRNRTLQNWKFWIFSIIIRSLFDTFSNMVSTASIDELCRSAAAWLDQHCSLVSLRPTVLNALRHLSMSTSILTEPQRVQEQAKQAVIRGHNSKLPKSGH